MTEAQPDDKGRKVITQHDFFFDIPLYDTVDIDRLDITKGDGVNSFLTGRVDAYSAANHIDTTYTIDSWKVDDYFNHGFDIFHKVKLTCVRKPDDILFFFVAIGQNKICKVGQAPSLANLSSSEITKRYAKHMDRDDMREFKKAIGLAAHGVGVGSFVYLRRIFEKLIDETYQKTKKTLNITEEDYRKQRMDEKVTTLADHLPSQLVKMKKNLLHSE